MKPYTDSDSRIYKTTRKCGKKRRRLASHHFTGGGYPTTDVCLCGLSAFACTLPTLCYAVVCRVHLYSLNASPTIGCGRTQLCVKYSL